MPKPILNVTVMFFTAIIILCSFNISKVSAQVTQTQTRAAELKQKYTWGSIYLTYGNICDITQILSKPEEARKLSSHSSSAVIPVLTSFLLKHKADNQRDGIAFLEINLNTQEAGFMKATDMDGVINRIPWTPSQVSQAGEFLDRFLVEYSQFLAVYVSNVNQDPHLADAWTSVMNAQKAPFVPKEKLTFLHIAFRVLAENKNTELLQMKVSNLRMFADIEDFKKRFDTAFAPIFSSPDRQQYIQRLAELNGTLQKDVLAPRTNLYTDPDKVQLIERGSFLLRTAGVT